MVKVQVEVNCFCEGCKGKIRKILEDEHGVEEVTMDEEEGRVVMVGEGLDADRILRSIKVWKSSSKLVQESPWKLGAELANETCDHDDRNQAPILIVEASPPRDDPPPPPPPPVARIPSPPRKLSPLAWLPLVTEHSFDHGPSKIRTRVSTSEDCITTIDIVETRLWIDKLASLQPHHDDPVHLDSPPPSP